MITLAERASTSARVLSDRLADALPRLYPFRPRLRDRRFWEIQVLLAAIAAVHFALESQRVLESAEGHIHSLFLLPISLFFVPVVYSALSFGLPGALATAAWATVLAIPNLVLFHDAPEQLGELVQIAMVDAVAVLAGGRVDRELRARHRAEAASAAFQASETKYRGLFQSSPSAIVVLDREGRIIDANPAAAALFDRASDALRGRMIRDIIGAEGSLRVLRDPASGARGLVSVRMDDDRELQLEPAVTWVDEHATPPLLQVVFRDATEEQQRRAGLRAYAAQVLRAQEAERKRIAQELHDETVQRVVAVCRQLDVAESVTLPEPSRAAIHDARRTAEDIVTELHDFARALRPPALEELGLVSAVRRVLDELAERAHLEVSLEVPPGERRLKPEIELALFRIAQEALRNVEHHAFASRVRVTITFGPSDVRLEVADDGVGFNATPDQDLESTGSLGLLGMRERAETAGGSLEVLSSPHGGTVVATAIPAGSVTAAD